MQPDEATQDWKLRVDERLAGIHAALIELRAVCDARRVRLDRMERCLYGNGETGIVVKVSAILWVTTGIAGFVGVLVAQFLTGLFH